MTKAELLALANAVTVELRKLPPASNTKAVAIALASEGPPPQSIYEGLRRLADKGYPGVKKGEPLARTKGVHRGKCLIDRGGMGNSSIQSCLPFGGHSRSRDSRQQCHQFFNIGLDGSNFRIGRVLCSLQFFERSHDTLLSFYDFAEQFLHDTLLSFYDFAEQFFDPIKPLGGVLIGVDVDFKAHGSAHG